MIQFWSFFKKNSSQFFTSHFLALLGLPDSWGADQLKFIFGLYGGLNKWQFDKDTWSQAGQGWQVRLVEGYGVGIFRKNPKKLETTGFSHPRKEEKENQPEFHCLELFHFGLHLGIVADKWPTKTNTFKTSYIINVFPTITCGEMSILGSSKLGPIVEVIFSGVVPAFPQIQVKEW